MTLSFIYKILTCDLFGFQNPPVTWIEWHDKGEYTVKGFFVDVWKELSEKLNFTYVYVLSVDNGTGSINPDGSWNGLIGMLLRKEINVAVSEFTVTEIRTHFVDFSVPILTTG